jgi:hypothetical protein
MTIRKKSFARGSRRKGRASCGTAILLNFLKSMVRRTAQKDGQDLPVRQTLPPAEDGTNSVKTLEKRGKVPGLKWHGACDSLCGTLYSDVRP